MPFKIFKPRTSGEGKSQKVSLEKFFWDLSNELSLDLLWWTITYYNFIFQ